MVQTRVLRWFKWLFVIAIETKKSMVILSYADDPSLVEAFFEGLRIYSFRTEAGFYMFNHQTLSSVDKYRVCQPKSHA